MNMRVLVIALVLLFVVGFLSPVTYWSFIHLARTIFILLIGFGIGYVVGRIKS